MTSSTAGFSPEGQFGGWGCFSHSFLLVHRRFNQFFFRSPQIKFYVFSPPRLKQSRMSWMKLNEDANQRAGNKKKRERPFIRSSRGCTKNFSQISKLLFMVRRPVFFSEQQLGRVRLENVKHTEKRNGHTPTEIKITQNQMLNWLSYWFDPRDDFRSR